MTNFPIQLLSSLYYSVASSSSFFFFSTTPKLCRRSNQEGASMRQIGWGSWAGREGAINEERDEFDFFSTTSLILFPIRQNTRKLLHVVDKSTHVKSALAHCTIAHVLWRRGLMLFLLTPQQTTVHHQNQECFSTHITCTLFCWETLHPPVRRHVHHRLRKGLPPPPSSLSWTNATWSPSYTSCLEGSRTYVGRKKASKKDYSFCCLVFLAKVQKVETQRTNKNRKTQLRSGSTQC